MVNTVNKNARKRGPKLSPSDRLEIVKRATSEGQSVLAREFCVDRAYVSRLCNATKRTYASKILEAMEQATVQGYRDKFEAGAEVLALGRSIVDNFRHRLPDGTIPEDAALSVRGNEQALMARTAAQTIKDGAAIMGWLVVKNETTHSGELTVTLNL